MIKIGNYRITRSGDRNLIVEHLADVEDKKTKETKKVWVFVGFFQDIQIAVRHITRLTEMDILEVSQDLEDFRARLAKYADEVCNVETI